MKHLISLFFFFSFTVGDNFNWAGFLEYCYNAGIIFKAKATDEKPNGIVTYEKGRHLLYGHLSEATGDNYSALSEDPIEHNWQIYVASTMTYACNANNPGGPCL